MTIVNEGIFGPLILVIGALMGAALADWLNHRSEIRRNRREKLEELIIGLGEVHQAFHAIFAERASGARIRAASSVIARFHAASSIILRVSALARIYCPQAHDCLKEVALETSRAAKDVHASVTGEGFVRETPPLLSSFKVVTQLREAEEAAVQALQDASRQLPEAWIVEIVAKARQFYKSLWSRQHIEK